MAQPSTKLAGMITTARARGYQFVRTSDGDGRTVTTGAFQRFVLRQRFASDAELGRFLTRILNTRVGCGYSRAPAKPRLEPERPSREADKDERVWAKPGRRGTQELFELPKRVWTL